MKCIINILFLVFVTTAVAGNLPAPPVLVDESQPEQDYFQRIYTNHNKLEAYTATKTNADEGEMWILTGAVLRFQIRYRGNTYSFDPD